MTQWLEFKNVQGLTIQGCGAVDGQGSQWWSGGSVAGDAKMVTEENLFTWSSSLHLLNLKRNTTKLSCCGLRRWTLIVSEQATDQQ